jgi:hypothetical protein
VVVPLVQYVRYVVVVGRKTWYLHTTLQYVTHVLTNREPRKTTNYIENSARQTSPPDPMFHTSLSALAVAVAVALLLDGGRAPPLQSL